MTRTFNLAGWLLSPIPLVLTALAVAFVFPEVVPMHTNLAGVIDSWAPKMQVFVPATVMTAANLVCALFMSYAEKMMAMGLVHGVSSPRAARLILLITIVFLDVLWVGILVWMAVQ